MDFPPVKSRWEARVAGVIQYGLSSGVVVAFFLVWGLPGSTRALVGPLLIGAVLVIIIVPRVLKRRAYRMQHKALRRIDFQVCPYCRYDLRELPPQGVCPECGVKFDPGSLERHWRNLLEPVPHRP